MMQSTSTVIKNKKQNSRSHSPQRLNSIIFKTHKKKQKFSEYNFETVKKKASNLRPKLILTDSQKKTHSIEIFREKDLGFQTKH